MRSPAHTARGMGDRRRPRHMSTTSGNRFWKRRFEAFEAWVTFHLRSGLSWTRGERGVPVPCQRCGFSPYCAPYVGGAACSLLRAGICNTAVRVCLPPHRQAGHRTQYAGRSRRTRPTNACLFPFCSFALLNCEDEKLCAGPGRQFRVHMVANPDPWDAQVLGVLILLGPSWALHNNGS